ncbi:MAG: gamma-glutamyl-gamma-aminobutyrate hydrolase family protein [Bacteroidales bacterium]|nr:gamma-glutamyl-gamma-aminobutyrate hydrolase family protein [Bacteroidales bacterium]
MKAKKFLPVVILLLALLMHICSCKSPQAGEPLRIAVSKLGTNYNRWLLETDSILAIENLYHLSLDSALHVLQTCHALLVTGGEDVYPQWHNKIEDSARCENFDRWRDTLEINLIKKALELKMPILGICRGHQITNVVLGGSLIIDIPSDVESNVIHRCPVNPIVCVHDVALVDGSLIHEITGQRSGLVTTYHHQAVDMLAHDLRISALSSDGIVEAIEWIQPQGKSFLLGVQWHPERMQDYPELSLPIAQRFVAEARLFKAKY